MTSSRTSPKCSFKFYFLWFHLAHSCELEEAGTLGACPGLQTTLLSYEESLLTGTPFSFERVYECVCVCVGGGGG